MQNKPQRKKQLRKLNRPAPIFSNAGDITKINNDNDNDTNKHKPATLGINVSDASKASERLG